MKFVGFTLKNDRTTLAGLPPPIHEGVEILKSHLYKSLADLQIEVIHGARSYCQPDHLRHSIWSANHDLPVCPGKACKVYVE
jgi:hypothetical protein